MMKVLVLNGRRLLEEIAKTVAEEIVCGADLICASKQTKRIAVFTNKFPPSIWMTLLGNEATTRIS